MDILVRIMFGVAYVAAPGLVNIETLRRGLRGGVWPALALQAGSLVGDLLWAILALAGVGLLLTHALAEICIGILGMGLLVYLGWSTLRSWRMLLVLGNPGVEAAAPMQPAGDSLKGCFWAGVAIATANPLAPAFWVSLGGVIGGGGPRDLGVLVAGFFLGGAFTGGVIALLVGLWSTRISPRLVRLTAHGCGLALISCGLLVGARRVLP